MCYAYFHHQRFKQQAMKQLVLAAAMMILGQFSFAQKITKVYGYWHYQAMGNIPVIPVEEGGNGSNPPKMKKPERRKVYYMYVECSGTQAPAISKIMLLGKTFTATVQKITELPAVYEYFDGQKTQKIDLVPKGRKNVFVVMLNETNAGGVQLASTEAIIEYKSGRVIKKAVLAKMKELPMPVVQ
jgi:hypothetical protein